MSSNKLSIIQKDGDKIYLKMQNTYVPCINFNKFGAIPHLDPSKAKFGVEQCQHVYEHEQNVQIRGLDEAFTAISKCKKCNVRVKAQ